VQTHTPEKGAGMRQLSWWFLKFFLTHGLGFESEILIIIWLNHKRQISIRYLGNLWASYAISLPE
jgi:hypothetical protein